MCPLLLSRSVQFGIALTCWFRLSTPTIQVLHSVYFDELDNRQLLEAKVPDRTHVAYIRRLDRISFIVRCFQEEYISPEPFWVPTDYISLICNSYSTILKILSPVTVFKIHTREPATPEYYFCILDCLTILIQY